MFDQIDLKMSTFLNIRTLQRFIEKPVRRFLVDKTTQSVVSFTV